MHLLQYLRVQLYRLIYVVIIMPVDGCGLENGIRVSIDVYMLAFSVVVFASMVEYVEVEILESVVRS